MQEAIQIPLDVSRGKIRRSSPRRSSAARRISGPQGFRACVEWAGNSAPHHQRTAFCSRANALRVLRPGELKKPDRAFHARVEPEHPHPRVQNPTAPRKSGRPPLRLLPKLAMRVAGFQKWLRTLLRLASFQRRTAVTVAFLKPVDEDGQAAAMREPAAPGRIVFATVPVGFDTVRASNGTAGAMPWYR